MDFQKGSNFQNIQWVTLSLSKKIWTWPQKQASASLHWVKIIRNARARAGQYKVALWGHSQMMSLNLVNIFARQMLAHYVLFSPQWNNTLAYFLGHVAGKQEQMPKFQTSLMFAACQHPLPSVRTWHPSWRDLFPCFPSQLCAPCVNAHNNHDSQDLLWEVEWNSNDFPPNLSEQSLGLIMMAIIRHRQQQ